MLAPCCLLPAAWCLVLAPCFLRLAACGLLLPLLPAPCSVLLSNSQLCVNLRALIRNLLQVEAFERAGVTAITLEDGDEIDDEYGDTMKAFVEGAEKDVLSEQEATAKGKDSGKLWGDLSGAGGTKEGLDKLVSFFGEDPKKFKAQDVLKILSATCDDYTKAGDELRKEGVKLKKKQDRQERCVF